MTPTPETPAPLSFDSPAIKDALQHYNLLKPLLRASLSNAQIYGLDLADALTHEHEARVRAEAAKNFHRDLGITILDAKYLDANCWKGCQSLVWQDKLRQAEAERDSLRKAKDGAYSERNQLVAALSKLFPASLERHPESDVTWQNDWRWVVYIDLPAGQASWHLHDSELSLFDHLPRLQGRSWDGHTTPEKYSRLAALSGLPAQETPARNIPGVESYIKTPIDINAGFAALDRNQLRPQTEDNQPSAGAIGEREAGK